MVMYTAFRYLANNHGIQALYPDDWCQSSEQPKVHFCTFEVVPRYRDQQIKIGENYLKF